MKTRERDRPSTVPRPSHEQPALPRIISPKELAALYPTIKLRTLRYWIAHSRNREVSRGGKRVTLPGNGLAPALIRKGRSVYIDLEEFRQWLEKDRCR
jgi:hypothetical protein